MDHPDLPHATDPGPPLDFRSPVALLAGYVLSWWAPGGYLLWSPLQSFAALALLGWAAWAAWKTRSLPKRAGLGLFVFLLCLAHWGFALLRSSSCGEQTRQSLSEGTATAILTEGDCGATTAPTQRIILYDGQGILRRRSILLESYADPEARLVSLEEHRIEVELRFQPGDSVQHWTIDGKNPGAARRFYRGVEDLP